MFWGLRGVEATTANLVLQTQVPMAVFLGWLVAGEELNLRKIMGTMIALVGVAIVIGLPEQRPALLPVTLIILGGFFWAFGQVLARKLSQDSGIMLLKANALMGIPQLILATAIFESGQWQSITSAGSIEWATLAFVGFVGFYLAYIAWFSLLRRCRMDEAAPFVLLMTPIGLLTAVIVLGERMSGAQLLGAAVLLLGLANRQWLSHAEAETGLALPAFLVFFQARHDFHEVAGRMAVIQLVLQDFIPRIPAGPGRTRQAENIFPLRNTRRGARLHRRGSDLRETKSCGTAC